VSGLAPTPSWSRARPPFERSTRSRRMKRGSCDDDPRLLDRRGMSSATNSRPNSSCRGHSRSTRSLSLIVMPRERREPFVSACSGRRTAFMVCQASVVLGAGARLSALLSASGLASRLRSPGAQGMTCPADRSGPLPSAKCRLNGFDLTETAARRRIVVAHAQKALVSG